MLNKVCLKSVKKINAIRGFTIIELVVVIILIGILAATVIPKMQSTGGYEEIIYQDETVTKLRSIQLRAMQDTSVSQCLLVYVTKEKLGIPDDSCTLPNLSFTSSSLQSNVIVKITEPEVSFDDQDGGYSFSFDQMGRPDEARTIILNGSEQTLTISINAEGYISAN
jgi:MSHA pilin protein MshC